MKGKITAILVCTAASLVLASCGGKEESSSRPIQTEPAASTNAAAQVTTAATTTKPAVQPVTHERHDYEDGVLIGRWEGADADIEFKENGLVSLEYDISEMMMINDDGTFMLSGDTYSQEYVSYDGTTLTVLTKPEEGEEQTELIKLVRKGDPDPVSYDGIYYIDNDYLKERLAGVLSGDEVADLDVEMKIKNGNFIIYLEDFCEYTQNGDVLELSVGEEAGELAEELGDTTFVLDDDKCVIYNSNGITEKFWKAD